MENNKYILFLDDDVTRAAILFQRWLISAPEKCEATVWVETAAAAIDTLKVYKGDLSEVYLDHDLGLTQYQHSGSELSGMEVVRYLENLLPQELDEFENTVFTIHSWNIPANKSMTERLRKLGLRVYSKPFGN